MSLIKFKTSEFAPVTFGSLIDKFFDESISRSGGSVFVPTADISETDKSFEIHLAAPGMKKEDFVLELNERYLTISGERKLQKEAKEKTWHTVQNQYGSFSRSFYLPENISASRIEAKYNDGILEVIIPKEQQKVLKTTIKVN